MAAFAPNLAALFRRKIVLEATILLAADCTLTARTLLAAVAWLEFVAVFGVRTALLGLVF